MITVEPLDGASVERMKLTLKDMPFQGKYTVPFPLVFPESSKMQNSQDYLTDPAQQILAMPFICLEADAVALLPGWRKSSA